VTREISGRTVVAGIVGAPVAHSLSPLIHNAWLADAKVDGVYVAFSPPKDGFDAFAKGLRGGAIRGLNVTVPFKETALALADEASPRARLAGAANLLIFEPGGVIRADNTDGAGLLTALKAQAADFRVSAGPIVILGAGGAARGAVAALIEAGAPEVRLVNRTIERARVLAQSFGAKVRVFAEGDAAALAGAGLIVNATSLGLGGGPGPAAQLQAAPASAVVMDMVYRPLTTEFLRRAEGIGMRTVDGLDMLLGQAAPSFEALFGAAPPATDVRGLCLAALEEGR